MGEIVYHDGMVGNFRLLGFATGEYLCHCHTCNKYFTGDKRAVQCLGCALETVDKQLKYFTDNLAKCSNVKCGAYSSGKCCSHMPCSYRES